MLFAPLALFGLSLLRRMRTPIDEVPVPTRSPSQAPKRLAKVETEDYAHPPRPPARSATVGPKDETAGVPSSARLPVPVRLWKKR